MRPEVGRSAIHPGEHLAEQLEALGISAAELGRRLDVPANRITAIINGQRSITGDTALRLGHFFGNSPQFWLNLQAIYDLRAACGRREARCSAARLTSSRSCLTLLSGPG